MGSHYFDEHPERESQERTITAVLRGRRMSLRIDHGVFSKNEVDFGSRMLADSFWWPEVEGPVLDMGCGYGPIGLSLARETNRMVWMADVNQRALELAEKNAAALELENTVMVKSDLFSSIEKSDFASILTNPPIRAGKMTVHSLFEQAYRFLAPAGTLWVVIQKKQGAPSAKDKLMSVFDEVDIVAKKKGYYIFCAKKN
ncbi:class I SAM-dependent methyltransferase [Salibacterium aidingense]|uniref:class I SAM-dependent methyltransferase n=1 Tax=Salibacterium aidingense TaxID=384933 RepID=UPI000424217B|nr:methyltransferase [Salibacterium aidingense]